MKTNYLQAMGIIPWRLRDTTAGPPPAPAVYCYRFVNENNECIGALIAEGCSAEERELLAAIRRALTIKTVACEWEAAPRLLLLGAHLVPRYSAPLLTVTHSLAEMLANPQLKAKVWQDLKKFIQALTNGQSGVTK